MVYCCSYKCSDTVAWFHKDKFKWPTCFVISVPLIRTTTAILTTDILFRRQVPEGTGWIMDGFPSTINQAKVNIHRYLLEKLTFYFPEHFTIFPYLVKVNLGRGVGEEVGQT